MPNRFFGMARRGGRWWLTTPGGARFFSLGLNHIDAAPLRYLESQELWRGKYGNSVERWLREAVAPDLRAWGFNSVGWTQEVVIRGDTIHRHSPPFTLEEYRWLGMPYCHLLPFAEIHQWDAQTRHPDFFGRDFEEWCDYVARAHCARMADDENLIGYFYSDCPPWTHYWPKNAWKGPLFPPERLVTAEGRDDLRLLAGRYYRVTHEAVRRYDPHHLILGDRYEAQAPLPNEILAAAAPFVDVFSFQHFGLTEQILTDLARWHDASGKPVLLADSARTRHEGDGWAHDVEAHAELLRGLRELPGCVGFHLCGAYLRNRVRRCGLRDEQERADEPALSAIARVNSETHSWVEGFTSA